MVSLSDYIKYQYRRNKMFNYKTVKIHVCQKNSSNLMKLFQI